MDCMDCGDEITGKRLQAIVEYKLEKRCLECQEWAHKEGRALGPQINPVTLLMRAEPDDNKREGWPEKQIIPDVVVPQEDEAA